MPLPEHICMHIHTTCMYAQTDRQQKMYDLWPHIQDGWSKKVKVAHTEITECRVLELIPVLGVINPAVRCHYFPPGPQLCLQPLRGLLPVLLLGEQRHNGCEPFAKDCYPTDPTAPESSTLTTQLPSHPRVEI